MNALLVLLCAAHTLHWAPPAHPQAVTGYRLYAHTGTTWKVIATAPKNATSWPVQGNAGDCFKVSALHGKRESKGIQACLR